MFENCAISHEVFGSGTVMSADETHISIRFSDRKQTEKTFQYPDAFESFLTFAEEEYQNQVMTVLAEKRAVQKKQQAERSAHFHQMDLARRRERAEKLKKTRKTAGTKSLKPKTKAILSEIQENTDSLAAAE